MARKLGINNVEPIKDDGGGERENIRVLVLFWANGVTFIFTRTVSVFHPVTTHVHQAEWWRRRSVKGPHRTTATTM